jgi:RHS repeat-associated protein
MQIKYLQQARLAFLVSANRLFRASSPEFGRWQSRNPTTGKILLFSSLIIFGFSLHGVRAGYEQGDSNPTGVSGIYNGNITTGCSYDSYTANAHREINDIVVPGCVGAYPLKWTRYWNSHMTYAASSNGGWNYSYLGFGYDSARSITYFPDGRTINCGGLNGCPSGYEEMDGPFGPRDGGRVVYQDVNPPYQWMRATSLVDPYGNVTTFTRETTAPWRITRVTEPGGRYLQIQYDTNSNVQSVQAFDGIAGHPFIQSVTYTWSNFTLATGTVKVLTRADYSDGTSATYTYTDQKYGGPPVCTYPFTSTDYHAALVATADDVRYAGPMRQIKYQYKSGSGNQTRIISEKNLVTGEAVSTIAGATGGGTTTSTETRGDGPTRTFHYHSVQHCVDCPPPDSECSPPEPIDGKLLDYTDFLGHTTTIAYDGNGFINSVTDANNHATTYTRGTGPNQQPWAIYQITHVVDGTYILQDYWNNNPPYLWHRTDELGHTTTFTRDANNRITHKSYPDGGYEDFTYNSFGEVLMHSRAQSASPLVIETESFVYDTQGRGLKTSWTDAAGKTTTYTYYASSDYGGVWTDRLKTVTKPANASNYQASETYEYDRTYVSGVDTGTPCAGRGLVTKIIHDDPANPGGAHGDGTYQTFTHDIYGNLLSSTDELGTGHTTWHTYDAYKRVLTTTDPLGYTITNNYVPTGKTSSWITTSSLPFYTTLHSTKRTTFYYDANWRKTRVQQAPGTGADEANSYFYYDTYAGYTNIGPLLAAGDPRGYVTKFHYDIRDRQDQITDALGASLGDPNHTTSFTFDPVGNKTTETHPNTGQGAELIEYDLYDAMNRLKHKKVHRDAMTIDQTSMSYDLAGNLATNTDERGFIYTYSYDPMNRRTSILYPPDDGNGNVQRSETTAYDNAGNILTYTNRSSAVQHFDSISPDSYDNRNRQRYFYWNDTPATTQTTVCDAASRVTQVVNTMSNGQGSATSTINHTFDPANQLLTEEEWTSALSDNVHRMTTYTYDVDGNRQTIQYPSGTAFNYTYTNRNQTSSIKPGLSGGTAIASYVYDTSGNITSCTRDNGTSTAFTVDVVNRDTAVVHTLVGTTPRRFDYAYNSVNDILVMQRDSGVGDGYQYDLTQQVREYQQNGTVNWGAGTVTNPTADNTLEFDGCGNRTKLNGVSLATPTNLNQPKDSGIASNINGNLQTWNGWAYTYDVQNRLVKATNVPTGTTTAYFYYDGKNRQIARWINNAVTFNVWDDWELIEEYGTGNVRTAAYLQGAHGPIKSLIANIYYFYQDELGSTSHIADATGHLLESYKYNLYGKPTFYDAGGNLIPASAKGVRDLFGGERFVTELGLYDLRNRYMLPDLGRFLQPDPIGFKGDASNLYRYCGNDWANKTDPMGLDGPLTDPFKITMKLRDSVADALGADLARQIRTMVSLARQAVHAEPTSTDQRRETAGSNSTEPAEFSRKVVNSAQWRDNQTGTNWVYKDFVYSFKNQEHQSVGAGVPIKETIAKTELKGYKDFQSHLGSHTTDAYGRVHDIWRLGFADLSSSVIITQTLTSGSSPKAALHSIKINGGGGMNALQQPFKNPVPFLLPPPEPQ